jgi:glycine/D-amino acid oxidase-like deaminating enzyme
MSETSDEHRILIIGGGIAGLATAWFLARRGARDVVLLERERELASQATAQNAAILRTPMPDALTEGLARESARFLRQPPPGFSPVPLLDPCGMVIASTRAEGERGDWEHRLDARALSGTDGEPPDVERLTPARLASLAPHFEAPVRRAWLLPREGRIDNAALTYGFESGARRAGVRFESGQAAQKLLVAPARRDSPQRPRVTGVRLADGRVLRADQTVIAAGAWAAELGRAAGSRVALRPTRRHLVVSEVDARIDARWPVVWTDGDPFYARPESGGLMLCGCDEVDVDPDHLETLPEERERALEKTARYLPRFADLRAAHYWAGIRTLTHDDRFVIGRDGDVDGLAWVAGLGGHGMTCSAAIGRLAADLIRVGTSAHPAAAGVDPARFSRRASTAPEDLRARR